MRSFVSFAIKNRYAFFIIFGVLSVLGYMLSFKLPEDIFPNVVYPRVVITVNANYEPIQKTLSNITIPMEQGIKSVEGVTDVRSRTGPGLVMLNVYFSPNTNPYRAYQMIMSKISELQMDMGVKASFDVRLMGPSAYSIAGYALVSRELPINKLSNIVRYTIKPALLSIPGVYEVDMVGGTYSTMDVVLNPSVIQKLNIPISVILNDIRSYTQNHFIGEYNQKNFSILVFGIQTPKDEQDILNIPIYYNNQTITLGDIAYVVKGHYPMLSYVNVDGYPSTVIFNIHRTNDANAIKIVTEVDKTLKTLKLPPHAHIVKWFDVTDFISSSIRSVIDAIIIGSLITLVVIALFLNNVRLSLLTAIVIPVSILCSLLFMYILHGSLNLMSLGGLAASIGALVDHAIVVMENIEKNINKPRPKLESVIDASSEILKPMTLATLTSVSVFAPLFFLSGIIGTFFKELALAVILALLISQFVSMTITPSIAYIAIPKVVKPEPNWLLKLTNIYKKLFLGFYKRKNLSILIVALLVLTSFGLYKSMKTGFLPEWDEGMFVLDFTGPSGASSQNTYQIVKHIEKIVASIPEVKHYSVRIGASLGQPRNPTNKGDMLITLKDHRTKSIFEVMREIRQKVDAKIHVLKEFDMAQVLRDRLGDITGQHAPFSVVIHGSDPETLVKLGEEIRDKIAKEPIFKEVNLKTLFYGPYYYISLKKDAYSNYGITYDDVVNTLKLHLWGITLTNYLKGQERIFIRAYEPFDPNEETIKDINIYSPKKHMYIPTSLVANIRFEKNVPGITRRNLQNVSVVRVKMHHEDLALGIRVLKKVLNNIVMPQGYYYTIEGFYKEQQQSFKEMFMVISFSVLIVLALLIFQFGSFLQALSVIFVLSLSVVGVFLALMITNKPLDVTSFMGMLLVLSVVVNNGILIFDYYNKELEENVSHKEAMLNACKKRFRPILMTMVADVLGFLPIALAIGRGTEVIQNMAISVMGGLFIGIFLSLLVLPIFYTTLRGIFLRLSRNL